MGISVEELENRINNLFDNLSEKITGEYKKIAMAKAEKNERYEKMKKLSSLMRDFDTDFQNKYTKLVTNCVNWAKTKFKDSKSNLGQTDEKTENSFLFGEELVEILLESFAKYSCGKGTFVQYLLGQLEGAEKTAKTSDRNFVMFGTKKRNKTFEKLLQIKKQIGIDFESDAQKFKKVAVNNLGYSEQEVEWLLKKYSRHMRITKSFDTPIGEDEGVVVGDYIEDERNESLFDRVMNNEETEKYLSLIDEFYNSGLRKSTPGSNPNLNRAANCAYLILDKIFFKNDEEQLKEKIEKHDFLKMCGDGILKLYLDKSIKEVSKRDFALVLGIPVSKLSDGYEDVYKNGERQLGKISRYFKEELVKLQEKIASRQDRNSEEVQKMEEKIDLIKRFFNF